MENSQYTPVPLDIDNSKEESEISNAGESERRLPVITNANGQPNSGEDLNELELKAFRLPNNDKKEF